MEIDYGKGTTEYGTGVDIKLTGSEVAMAIETYLIAHNVRYTGPRTITVNDELCREANVYVDPSGSVIADGIRYSGRGPADMPQPDDIDPVYDRPGTVHHPRFKGGPR